ncbi:hypothetical protein KM043_017640 [Ampulex compressa]|nr:hypothetical protein KM043_017640 [Ampulex compressa]
MDGGQRAFKFEQLIHGSTFITFCDFVTDLTKIFDSNESNNKLQINNIVIIIKSNVKKGNQKFIRNPANYPDYLKEPKKFGTQKREVKLTDFHSQKVHTPDSALKNDKSTYDTDMINYNLKPIQRKGPNQKYGNRTNSTETDSNYKHSISLNKYHGCMENNSNLHFNPLQNNLVNNNVTVLVGNRSKRQVFDFELPEDVKLFAGFVFISSPHRHRSSKWYVSLKEYPYHLWPPYITAGAYILSKDALLDMYYTSLYTKHFQFDDIFLGLVAKKANIEPFHCEEFHFYKKDYTKFNYKYVITSHGYSDPNELLRIWNEQKALGNA